MEHVKSGVFKTAPLLWYWDDGCNYIDKWCFNSGRQSEIQWLTNRHDAKK